MAGFLSFDEGTIVALFSKIQSADFTYPKWFSMDIRSVIDTMLVADPQKRVTLDQLRQVPWLQEKIPAWKLPPDDDRAVPPPVAGGPTPGTGTGAGSNSDNTTVNNINIDQNQKTDGEGDVPNQQGFAEEYSKGMQKPKSFYPGGMANGGDAFEALDESIDAGSSKSHPKVLNAFDLINQCGGFALDKLFAPQVDISTNEQGHLVKKMSSKAMLVGGGGGGKSVGPSIEADGKLTSNDRHMLSRQASVRYGGASSRRTGSYHFSSKITPAENLMGSIYSVVKEMGFELEDSREICQTSGKCKCTIRTAAKGMLGLTIYSYTLCSTLSLLEIRRGKGDLLEWNTIYDELINNKFAHLINRPSAEGEAKSDMSPRPGVADA